MSNKRKMNDTKNPDEGDTGTSFAVKAPVSMAPSSTPMSSWTPINRPRPPPPTTLTQIKSKHPAASTIPATVAAASVNITNMTNKRMSTTMDSNEVPWCPNYENKPLGCQDVYCTLKHSMVRRDAAYMKVEDASEDDSAEEDVEASAAENVAPAAMNYAVKATPTSTTSKDKMPTTTSFIACIPRLASNRSRSISLITNLASRPS